MSTVSQTCDAVETQVVLKPVAQTLEARVVWLSRSLLRWPAVPSEGVFKLYHAASPGIVAVPGAKPQGADGALVLDLAPATLPPALDERFKHVAAGATLEHVDEIAVVAARQIAGQCG